jgi:hypothetical protein
MPTHSPLRSVFTSLFALPALFATATMHACDEAEPPSARAPAPPSALPITPPPRADLPKPTPGPRDDGVTGWTIAKPAADTRLVHVDPQGDDARDGATPATAVRSLARAYLLMRPRQPDHLLLKAGGVWENQWLGDEYGQWRLSGRAPDARMVITSYGEGPRPRIRLAPQRDGIHMSEDGGINHLAIIGIEFDGSLNSPTRGVGVKRRYAGDDFLMEDCLIRECASGFILDGVDKVQKGITIRRNVIVDNYSFDGAAHSQGMYVDWAQGVLIEQNVLDHNGWREGKLDATIYNHNAYIQYNVTDCVFRENIVARGSATGAQLRAGDTQGLNNLVLANPIGISGGSQQAPWPKIVWSGRLEHNVVLGAIDIPGKGQIGGEARGWGVTWIRAKGARVAHNLVAHGVLTPRTGGNQARGLYSEDAASDACVVEGNVVYDWPGANARGAALVLDRALVASETLRDNTFAQPTQGFVAIVPNKVSTLGGLFASNTFAGPGDNPDHWVTRENMSGVRMRAFLNDLTRDANAATALAPAVARFPDPTRSIATYLRDLGHVAPASAEGGPPANDLEAFLLEARALRRGNWRDEFSAASVNRYMRAGFGMSEPAP